MICWYAYTAILVDELGYINLNYGFTVLFNSTRARGTETLKCLVFTDTLKLHNLALISAYCTKLKRVNRWIELEG